MARQTSDCPFCAIAGGADAHRVWEDEQVVAFLDTRPLFPGHTLVVPREHVPTLTELPADRLGGFLAAVQRLAGAMEHGFGAAGSLVAVNNRVSQSVPHLHAHVVPRNPKDGLRGFFWPRTRYRDEEHAAETARTLRRALGGSS
ncbi:HIT family protein [Allostreptomyces psammosilenae]|uniref:Histidine triad (HIT) family protein n=1 Tax=Allostreptomyces psammosilenae TaxID=1892865 RepID=A0A852ZSG1_9ACTN|nr:HIT family protein [Allostreptomyces psammosilenae]NYI04200.1 histidine triad (HIT) family protein [Allostreptomyces psammosilenae]